MGGKHYLLCSVMLPVVLVSPAWAQDIESTDQNKPAQRGGLQEIVVTAQKRAQNVQDVPIAVTAITGNALADQRVLDTRSLQQAVPTLQYGNAAGFALPFLRGIGSALQTPGTEPSVATFVDGVYVASNSATMMGLLGIDRVEVLAGPQGTLYGRNTSGGAINIYTLTPSQSTDAQVKLTYGNYDRIEASGYASGPLTDNLVVGIYATAGRRDTYYHFDPRPADQSLQNSFHAVRVKAVWDPTEAIRFTGSYEYSQEKTVDTAFRNAQPGSMGVTLFGGDPKTEEYLINVDAVNLSQPRSHSLMLREEFDLGFADLVGITGYRHLDKPTGTDLDGTTAPLVSVFATNFSRQFTQEVQLLSKPGGPLEWIAGLYYFYERAGYAGLQVRSDILFEGAFNRATTDGDLLARSYAAFAQGTVTLADGLRLTVGGRYTRDKKEKEDAIVSYSIDGTPVGIPPDVVPGAKKSWSKFTPRVTLEYKINDTLLYATYSKGFKSGQFNASDAADRTAVDPESLTDYEVGLKTDLFDRRLRINAAAYYYDFTNLQVQVLDPTGGGVAARLQNAAKARAYGVEATVTAALTDALTINASAAWEDSKYTNFQNAPFVVFSPTGNSQIPLPATGNDLIYAPKFVGSFGATYKVDLGAGSLDLHGDVYYNDGYAFTVHRQFMQPSYTLVNASVTYHLPGDQLSLQAWGTNLTNAHRFAERALSVPFGAYQADDAPRMYGVTLTWKYR